MTEQNFKFRDPVVQNVCKEFVRRSDVGYEKYGQTPVSYTHLRAHET